jgi:hypothetical protein
MKKKNFIWWIIFILLFVWQLPQNIVAIVMLPFLGKRTLIRVDKYCFAFEAENMSGGISLGNFIFLSSYSAIKEETILHEYGHVVDSHIMGPLYLLIIGIPSILNAAFNFTNCYYDWFPEKWANKHAGLKVDNKCRTYIPKK